MKRRLTLALTVFGLTLGSGLSMPTAMSAPCCTTLSFTGSTVGAGGWA